jgi:hypothetical protein
MPTIYDALEAFLQEHRRCRELDGGVEGERVWMTSESGGQMSCALDRQPALVDR